GVVLGGEAALAVVLGRPPGQLRRQLGGLGHVVGACPGGHGSMVRARRSPDNVLGHIRAGPECHGTKPSEPLGGLVSMSAPIIRIGSRARDEGSPCLRASHPCSSQPSGPPALVAPVAWTRCPAAE